MKAIHSTRELLLEELEDLRRTALQVAGTMRELSGWASSSDLRRFLTIQGNEAAAHGVELRRLLERRVEEPPGAARDETSDLLEGWLPRIEAAEEGQVRDLLLVGLCTRLMHQQIGGTRFTASLADCLNLMADASELSRIARRHGEVLEELSQVAANFFSPCLLESGRS
jgi:hypothetical protein